VLLIFLHKALLAALQHREDEPTPTLDRTGSQRNCVGCAVLHISSQSIVQIHTAYGNTLPWIHIGHRIFHARPMPRISSSATEQCLAKCTHLEKTQWNMYQTRTICAVHINIQQKEPPAIKVCNITLKDSPNTLLLFDVRPAVSQMLNLLPMSFICTLCRLIPPTLFLPPCCFSIRNRQHSICPYH